MPRSYTNRMRRSDYWNLLGTNGFEIVAGHYLVPANAFVMLQSVQLSERFRSYHKGDLMITRGIFYTKKTSRGYPRQISRPLKTVHNLTKQPGLAQGQG